MGCIVLYRSWAPKEVNRGWA